VENINLQGHLTGCSQSEIRLPVLDACRGEILNVMVENLSIVNPATGEIISLPEDLATTLIIGNFTGGTDVVESAGDQITSLAGDSLLLRTGDNPGGNAGPVVLNPGTAGGGGMQGDVVVGNGGHLQIAGTGSPIVTNVSGVGALVVTSPGATDQAGRINVTIGAGPVVPAGPLVSFVPFKAFIGVTVPVIILTHSPSGSGSADQAGAAVPLYITAATVNGFTVNTSAATTGAATDLSFNYWIMDTAT
jgi:hypothetical protein